MGQVSNVMMLMCKRKVQHNFYCSKIGGNKITQVDMSDKMVNIDGNLDQVKRNLEYLEEMYDTVFRKVNRLFVDVEI